MAGGIIPDIIAISTRVRASEITSSDLDDVCEECHGFSVTLRDALRNVGFLADVVYGDFETDADDPSEEKEWGRPYSDHYWVEVTGRDEQMLAEPIVADITADQFNDYLNTDRMNPVEVGPYERFPRLIRHHVWEPTN